MEIDSHQPEQLIERFIRTYSQNALSHIRAVARLTHIKEDLIYSTLVTRWQFSDSFIPGSEERNRARLFQALARHHFRYFAEQIERSYNMPFFQAAEVYQCEIAISPIES